MESLIFAEELSRRLRSDRGPPYSSSRNGTDVVSVCDVLFPGYSRGTVSILFWANGVIENND